MKFKKLALFSILAISLINGCSDKEKIDENVIVKNTKSKAEVKTKVATVQKKQIPTFNLQTNDGKTIQVIADSKLGWKFKGLEDKVVLPDQAEAMVEALRKKGLPVAYITFHDEGHGFRKGENIKKMLEAELYFYSKIFGFELPEKIEPIKIENLTS